MVLSPNSGIAIEALHSGTPTFYTLGSDYLPDDYYGFVADGIIPVFDIALLDRPDQMCAFFNDAWKNVFARHDETMSSSPAEMKEEVRASFNQLLN